MTRRDALTAAAVALLPGRWSAPIARHTARHNLDRSLREFDRWVMEGQDAAARAIREHAIREHDWAIRLQDN